MDPNNSPDSIDGSNAMRSVDCAIHTIQPHIDSRRSTRIQQVRNTPKTSESRRQASLLDEPVGLEQLTKRARENKSAPQTYLYLAYGSNLCALTFRERRGIQPLSQINVVVPEIALSFDLSGIPYTEPCFGNCRYRDTTVKDESNESTNDYHKNRWKKGLVGVVYEVTEKDYIHIIETEGGGSGYKDVLVDCYHLEDDPNVEVPILPTGVSFKAHTLFAPARTRPDPSYAQPSARYKKLITDGAEECNLPHEYRKYLDGIRPYQITTQRQRLGLFVFALVWLPILSFIFLGAGKIFLGKNGLYPPWYVKFTNAVFEAVWASYDHFFKPTFGDGERTIKNGGSDEDDKEEGHIDQEKTPLLGGLRSERTKSSQEVV